MRISKHRSRARGFLILAVSLLWLRAAAQVPVALTYRFSGWLHASGTNLFDDQNHPVRILGVNHSGAEWGAGNETGSGLGNQFGTYSLPQPVEYEHLTNWGFNSVRLLLSWANLEPAPPVLDTNSNTILHSWNQGYLTNVDAMIDAFGQRRLAVILSLHQWTFSPVFTNQAKGIHGLGMPVWLYYDTNASAYKTVGGFQLDAGVHSKQTAENYFFGNPGTNSVPGVQPEILPQYPSPSHPGQGYNVQDGYIDAWRFLAARYSTNPVVIGADLYNEPPNDPATKLKKLYNQLGSNVAAVNPRLLLICQDSGSQPTDLTGLLGNQEGEPGLSNLVYSIHFYVDWWSDQTGTNGQLQHHGARSYLTNYQATSVRWNVPFWVGEFDKFTPNGSFNLADMQLMMQYCRANAISWSYFAYDRADKPLDTNAVVDAGLVQLLQSGFDTPLNQLSIAPAGQQVALSWPASYLNFVPEWTPSLTQTNWVPLSQTPVTANFQNTLFTTPGNGAGFYRLRSR